MNRSESPQAAENGKTASSLATLIVLITIAVCILSCGLILAVPTRSISATTVYRGF